MSVVAGPFSLDLQLFPLDVVTDRPSSFRSALREMYPLAGHKGDCRKVLAAGSSGSLQSKCTCGFESEN